ncbi:MAG TPA: lyase [Alphaproteobacteria bacterium]
MNRFTAILAFTLVLAAGALTQGAGAESRFQTFKLPVGNYPHDVAPGPNGTIFYADQRRGGLGIVDPKTGKVEKVALGEGSAPHNVMVGPDGKAWLTDGGQNAMVSYDPKTKKVTVYKLPEDTGYTNLNTAAVDRKGDVWFTGQNGIYGKVDVKSGKVTVWKAPKGRGPYGITATKSGDVYYASLAGSHVGRINIETGQATVLEPPTKDQGARRVWADSRDRIWVSEWNSGNVSVYDPASNSWKTWKLPGSGPRAYAVYVDDQDKVWLADWGANALVKFDPVTEKFEVFPFPVDSANVRQIDGRKGEILLPLSGPRLVAVFKK